MTDVLPFKPKIVHEEKAESLYLVCSKCSIMSFNIVAHVATISGEQYAHHYIRCNGCGDEVVVDGEFAWDEGMPDLSKRVNLSEAVNAVSTGEAEFAKRLVVKQVEEWSSADTLALVAAFDTDAASKMWMNFETEDQRQWILRRLDELKKTVENWNNMHGVKPEEHVV